jgi:peptide methionine sulfoxide reductase msrA/msrB
MRFQRRLIFGLALLGFACHGERAVPSRAPAPNNAAEVPPSARETAILAGGCFWGMEEILRQVPGVLETEVGYAGGVSKEPDYESVKSGTTGHAESVRVVFDPAKIAYAELLEKWFFRMHDPTTKNRQGNDVGSQYRSAIFYTTEEQRKIAEAVKARMNESGKWGAPLVTEIVPSGGFTPAESHHQDYLQKHPDGYTCHYLRDI